MISRRPFQPVFPVLAAISLGASTAGSLLSQDAKKLKEIPSKLFQIQDSQGFFWQAAGNGALTSGETQYLQSGLNLIVAGEAFEPTSAEVQEPGEGVETVEATLSENRDGLTIRRNLWFDEERAGVRVFDQFTNTSEVSQTLAVELRTTYPFGWQSLHNLEGQLLSSDPGLQLGEQDMGLVVRFSPSEGRHDTVILTSSETGGMKPSLKASANARELTFAYDLILKAGESKSLLHWILQRNVPELSESGADIGSITQRGRLIRPGVTVEAVGAVANFDAASFPDESTAPAQLRSLVALNSLTDRIGFHRRSDDVLWINASNQISGKVSRDATLSIDASYVGKKNVPLSEVAAIQGSGGVGRTARVYLRDGRVLVGAVESSGLGSLTGEDGDELDLDQINLLLLGTEPNDGVAPGGAEFFLQMKDGTVLAAKGAENTELRVATSWGMETPTLSQISEIGFLSAPTPRWRIVSATGSRYSGFLSGESITVTLAGSGEATVPAVAVSAMWLPGHQQTTISDSTEAWLDFSEVPAGLAREETFLLVGNDLIGGTIGDDYLMLKQSGSYLKIAADRVVSITRQFDTEPGRSAKFQIVLDSGDRLEGNLEGPYLSIRRDNKSVSVPIDRLIAYRKESP